MRHVERDGHRLVRHRLPGVGHESRIRFLILDRRDQGDDVIGTEHHVHACPETVSSVCPSIEVPNTVALMTTESCR